MSEGVGGSVGAGDFAMVDAYLAGLEDTTGMEQLLREQFRLPRPAAAAVLSDREGTPNE